MWHLRDRDGAALPRYKTRAEITVFDGTPIWYGFCAGAKAIRYGVIKALIVASGIFVSILGSQTLDVKFAIIFLRYGYSVL